jgi:hypothetical protein
MFVITADQRDSRVSADLVPTALRTVADRGDTDVALAPERTAGDEIQVALTDAGAALDVALELTRSQQWAVGIGVGAVETPLPESVRAGRGEAFVHARNAVERAKRASTRLALTAADGADAEALVRLLVEVRDRRTAEGWEVYDLLTGDRSQRDVAALLGISESAVSLRVKAAGLRVEEAAVPALVRILQRLDDSSGRAARATG